MIQSLKPLAQAALNVGRFVTGPRTATTADMAPSSSGRKAKA